MKLLSRWTKIWFKGNSEPFELITDNFGSLVAFEVCFRIMSFLVLFPIIAWAERLWLLGSRTKVIAWYNAGAFIKNPVTWVVLLFMIIVLVWATMLEQFALYDTMHASKFGIRRKPGQILSAGFDMCVRGMRLENLLLIPYVILILRFGTITGDVSSVISGIRIPGFILEDFSKHPWEKTAFICFQVIAIILYIRWLFAVPVMVEERKTSFRAACRKSAAMTKGRHFFKAAFVVAGWALLILFFYYAGTAVVVSEWYLLSRWLLPKETGAFLPFFTSHYVPVSLIFYIFFLWIVTPIIAAAFQCLYYNRKEELGEELIPYTEQPGYFKKYPVWKWLIVGICVVSIFFSGPERFQQLRWMLNTDYGVSMIMAHRGYSAAAPENTIPAFQKCIDEGFTAAELDVQMLGDGTIIVMHDDNLKRTTGVDKNVWEVTYNEIRDLDNGSFFDKSFKGTKIPTLDEVIKLAGRGENKLYLNIEIKRNGHDDGITQKVVDIIQENNYLQNCDVTSQDYDTLEEIKKIDLNVLTAYTSVIGIGEIEKLDAADIISIQETFATYENVNRIHRAGKRIFVWTVNEKETMEDLVTLNVDAILTNDPALCKEVIQKHDTDFMSMVNRIHSAFSFL